MSDISLILERGDRVMTVRVAREVASGPPGPPGPRGDRGDSVIQDPGDLTLMFDNKLL